MFTFEVNFKLNFMFKLRNKNKKRTFNLAFKKKNTFFLQH